MATHVTVVKPADGGPKETARLTLLERAAAAGLVVNFRTGVIRLPDAVLRELFNGARSSALAAKA